MRKTFVLKSNPDGKVTSAPHILILFAGFSATIIQVLLIRELTSLFQGNEIMMSWTLAVWMILTGLGTLTGRRIKIRSSADKTISWFLILVTTLPVILLALLNLIKNRLFLPGVLIGPWEFILLLFVLLSPVCILSGALFSLFIRNKGKEESYFVRVYIWEAVGSVTGGLIVSFLFIRWLTIFQSLLVIAALAAFLLFVVRRKIFFLTLATLLTICLILLFSTPIERRLKTIAMAGNEVLEYQESPFGNLMVTGEGGEYNYFLNGSLLFSSGNFIQREEFVHYALLQHPDPGSILLVSGGISGMVEELLKYPEIRHIDYLETNDRLLRLVEKNKTLPDTEKLSIWSLDVHRVFSHSERNYDIAILAVPPPSSIQMNRYYTSEFLARLKPRLNPGAVLIYGLEATGNYMSESQRNQLSIIYNTLKNHFSQVLILPGEKDYLVASDRDLDPNIAAMCSIRKIENLYVNMDYLNDTEITRRSQSIRDQIKSDVKINTNNKALPVFYSSLHYLSLSDTGLIYLLLPLLLIPILLFVLRSGARGIYIAGMSGASIEIMLLFMLQTAFGTIYSMIGVLVSLFMAGLILGALLSRKITVGMTSYRISFLIFILFLACFYLLLKIDYPNLPAIILWPVLVLCMIIPSGLTGFIFVASAQIYPAMNVRAAPMIYAVDLAGSSLGMLSMTLVLIPVIGLQLSCLLLIGLNLIPVILRKPAV